MEVASRLSPRVDTGKAQAMNYGFGLAASDMGMVMALDRMRDTGMMGPVRQRVSGFGKMAREIQHVSASAVVETTVQGKPRANTADSL